MNNPHRYEDASNSWSEYDWMNNTAVNVTQYGSTRNGRVDITESRLHRLNLVSDKHDYTMAQVGKCRRLGFAPQCTCEAECVLVQMHNKWKEQP